MTATSEDDQREAEALASLFATALALSPEPDFGLPADACCINQQKCQAAARAWLRARSAGGETSTTSKAARRRRR